MRNATHSDGPMGATDFCRPAEWEAMGLLQRMRWLVAEGIAPDDLEAVGVLRAIGEFPSEEELGMCNGRALSEGQGARCGQRGARCGERGAGSRERHVMRTTATESVPAVCLGSVGRALWD